MEFFVFLFFFFFFFFAVKTKKAILTFTPVVYATDRSKVAVPVLFLFCVALWFILRGTSCFIVFPCSLSSCFFIPFSIVITSLGKRELVCVLLVHLFVCFVRVSFCHFSLPLGVGGWLQFVIVALPEPSINVFSTDYSLKLNTFLFEVLFVCFNFSQFPEYMRYFFQFRGPTPIHKIQKNNTGWKELTQDTASV